MNDFGHILAWLQRIEREHEAFKANVENMFRVGPVVERDKDKGVRLKTDADGDGGDAAHKSDWGNPAERSGFERAVPPMGAHCLFIAPFGDQAQGIVIPYGHNDANPNPASDVDEIVLWNHGKIKASIAKDGKSITFTNDKSSVTLEGAKISHTVDGQTTTFEKDLIKFPDGTQKVQHGDRNIGKSHVHGGVKSGGDKTADPDE